MNIFCGLHLLEAMADVCEASVKKFENFHSDDKDMDLLYMQSARDSTDLRVVHCACLELAQMLLLQNIDRFP